MSPEKGTTLEFITFTDLGQISNRETKKKVRRHVQRRVQKSRRDARGLESDRGFILDTSLLFRSEVGPYSDETGQLISYSHLIKEGHMLPQLASRAATLGAGAIDPFANYPITMNKRTHELFLHLHGDFCPMFRTMCKAGFYRNISDAAGFRQVLYTSALHQAKLRGSVDPSDAVTLSTQAIQSVNSRLDDSHLAVTDGVIGAVLAFASHANMFHNIHEALIHLNGLEQILRQRGGLVALRNNNVARVILFWIDVDTAFMGNTTPRFPIPMDLLPNFPFPAAHHQVMYYLIRISEVLQTERGVLAMSASSPMNVIIDGELSTKDVLIDGEFQGDSIAVMEECCRMGTILYLGAIRRLFGFHMSTSVYIQGIKTWFGQDDALRETYNVRGLWVLMVAALQSFGQEEHEWFVSNATEMIIRCGCSLWEEVMVLLRETLWVEGVFGSELETFRGELSNNLWLLSHERFS